MAETNFLIGKGELLTSDVRIRRGGSEKAEVYSFREAFDRLSPLFRQTANMLDGLPAEACPGNIAVALLTLNPSYIAKSHFPSSFLRRAQLVALGSRNTRITPQKWTKKENPFESSTTEIFVAGDRHVFRDLSEMAVSLANENKTAIDFARIERFAAFEPQARIVQPGFDSARFFEVGLHLMPDDDAEFVMGPFRAYAEKQSVKIHEELYFRVGNLWFVPIEGDPEQVKKLADFVFVRVIRVLPKLRGLHPIIRSNGVAIPCSLPEEAALSSEPRVAILDGGLPEHHSIQRWLRTYRKSDENAADHEDGVDHGLGVTSAFLFGPIHHDKTARRPYAAVSHVRVFDKKTTAEDNLELYRTLGFVEEALLSRQYQFVNLSLGPDLPIEDTEVHAWTSVIDSFLSDGETFMTIAAGNNGELDKSSGNARIQVPADCVNAVSVGASDTSSESWAKAPYSALGPGRSPGVVKPDVLTFGGSLREYFHTLVPGNNPNISPQLGTSFASPYLLRIAVGIRATFGDVLLPLAIKALIIHGAEAKGIDKTEVGWGKVPDDIIPLVSCAPGIARVVYQGELRPGKYLRAPIPLPDGALKGKVTLKATFCYASPVDPQDAGLYTRAGLDITFRPNKDKKDSEEQKQADTASFFKTKAYAHEDDLRSDSGKWETVLHARNTYFGSSLNEPAFDIHYNARDGGRASFSARNIKYALIVTIEALNHPDLYADILRTYANTLVPIDPQVHLPVEAQLSLF